MNSLIIRKGEAGRTVGDLLRSRFRLSRENAQRLSREGCVRLGPTVCHDLRRRVRAGERLILRSASKPAGSAAPPSGRTAKRRQLPDKQRSHGQPRIVFADAHIVVVDKPAGLTTVRHAHEAEEFGARGKRFLPATLADLLPPLLAKGSGRPERVRAVHRLDNETSGLVVLARTAAAERHLGKQFRAHTIERRYLALVRGRAEAGRIESLLVRDRGDGRRGSGCAADQGQRAVTHVRVLEELGAYTLVECRLDTGRTHQVRIHLGERGTPLCGERVYDRPLHGKPLADASRARRPALHATFLAIDHPLTGKRMQWTSLLPKDMRELLDRLSASINAASASCARTPDSAPQPPSPSASAPPSPD